MLYYGLRWSLTEELQRGRDEHDAVLLCVYVDTVMCYAHDKYNVDTRNRGQCFTEDTKCSIVQLQILKLVHIL